MSRFVYTWFYHISHPFSNLEPLIEYNLHRWNIAIANRCKKITVLKKFGKRDFDMRAVKSLFLSVCHGQKSKILPYVELNCSTCTYMGSVWNPNSKQMSECKGFEKNWKQGFRFGGCRELISLCVRVPKVKLSHMLSFIAVSVWTWVPYESPIANSCKIIAVLKKIWKERFHFGGCLRLFLCVPGSQK